MQNSFPRPPALTPALLPVRQRVQSVRSLMGGVRCFGGFLQAGMALIVICRFLARLSNRTAENLPLKACSRRPPVTSRVSRKVAAAKNLTLLQRLTTMRRIETIEAVWPFGRDLHENSLSAAYPMWGQRCRGVGSVRAQSRVPAFVSSSASWYARLISCQRDLGFGKLIGTDDPIMP
jgi:hypothetical protein